MRALLFAAGRGERMRPLTDRLPKPLLEAGGRPLIAWHLDKLAALGVDEVVINTSWLHHCFAPALGDGSRFGLRIHYLHEGDTPLETGGGMLNALPLLGDAPFLVVNGDVWTDFDFRTLPPRPSGLAHLVMVDNPPQHPEGDFVLGAAGQLHPGEGPRLTYAGIGLYHPRLLDGWREVVGDTPGGMDPALRFALAPLLSAAMARGEVTGQHHRGRWTDVGTPERLQALRAALS